MGRRARRHQEDLRPARHPRSRAQVSLRRLGTVRVRGRLPQRHRGTRKRRRPLLRHGYRTQTVSRDRPEVPRHRYPGRRQQVRRAQQRGVVGRLVRLRAQGRRSEDAAPSLFPDQHREHGPVRAHADHRRRRLEGALHRGLHRAEVFDVVAALRRGRADRDGRRLDPLHDDPELVSQHLQPRHEARGRATRTRPSNGSTATSARASR